MKMFLFEALCPLLATLLVMEAAKGEEECVFFNTNTRVVPNKNGYKATLTFSVHNTCEGERSAIRSIKVVKVTEQAPAERICTITYTPYSSKKMSGCTEDPQSHTFSVTSDAKSLEDGAWILLAELWNGNRFNKAVEIRPELASDKPEGTSVILMVSVTVSVVVFVVVTLTIITIVCCVRKKNARGASKATRAQQPVLPEDPYYLHPASPAIPLSSQPPTGTEPRQHQRLLQSDEDEEGYTCPDRIRCDSAKGAAAYFRQEKGVKSRPVPRSIVKSEEDEYGYTFPDLAPGDSGLHSPHPRSVKARAAPKSVVKSEEDEDGYTCPDLAPSDSALHPPHLKNVKARLTPQSVVKSEEDEDGYTYPQLTRLDSQKRAASRPSHQADVKAGLLPKSAGESEENNDGYTMPDLPRCAAESKRNVPKPLYKNTGVFTKGASTDATTLSAKKYDDDGYIQPDPAEPGNCEKAAPKPFYANTCG